MGLDRRTAAVAFGLYLAASLAVGDVFPLSRYSMYADVGRYRESYVPVFLAQGRPANPRDYHRFAGIEPDDMGPGARIGSHNYRVDEDRRWIASHSTTEIGPVPVAYGYRSVRLTNGEIVYGPMDIVARGTAWPR